MSFPILSSSSPSTSPKRLRPCLSPLRGLLPSGDSTATSSASTSRSVSASSNWSMSSVDDNGCRIMKRSKSVRWEGESDEEGCVVTSYYSTYSADDYDRTPLAPPSEAERACVLPARGARCLSSPSLDCDGLLDDPTEHADVPNPGNIDRCISPEPISEDAENTSPLFREIGGGGWFKGEEISDEETTTEENEHEEESKDEDDEWSECVERRRMMFARMCPFGKSNNGEEERHHPEFEGYRSLSATLVDLLRSVGSDGFGKGRGDSTPHGTPLEGLDEEDEEVAPMRIGIRDLSMNRSVDGGAESETETIGSDTEVELDTPSLVSSAGSEADCTISSPDRSVMAANHRIPRIVVDHHREWVSADDEGVEGEVGGLAIAKLEFKA